MTSDAELLLIGFDWPAEDRTASDAMRAVTDRVGAWQLYRSSDDREGYAWFRPGEGEGATAETVRRALTPHGLVSASVRALRSTLQLQGASAGADAPWCYVVETDVVPEHEADFNAWYDEEHAPGLAAVPGTVHGARYVDTAVGASPRYLAVYALTGPETLDSAAWLAVRGTDWSSRVRPMFRNTKRTMYRRVSGG